MICQNCKEPKEKSDFYWRKTFPYELINSCCKKCVKQKKLDKQKRTPVPKDDFLYQYFS